MPDVDDWKPVAATPATSHDDWQPVETGEVPQAFIDRVERGNVLTRILKRSAGLAKEGYGDPTTSGMSKETEDWMIGLGLIHDPVHGQTSPLQMLVEDEIFPITKSFDMLVRGINAGIYGAAGALGEIADSFGGQRGQTEREVINFANWAMIEGGMGRFSRPQRVPSPIDQVVGELPKQADFKAASEIVAQQSKGAEPSTVEKNLRSLWEEKGIHPAEAVNDARSDAFLKESLTTPVDEAGEPLRAVGAEVTDETPSVQSQPPATAGALATATKNAIDSLYDIGHDIQMLTTPMARGTAEAQATAKDFANAMRRNRWDWSRIDEDIAKRFTPEQRKRMWDAADEESVLRQELKDKPEQLQLALENMGLSTLSPAERDAVVNLQTRAQTAWLRAVDTGIVEGEGLPSYTPRMIINAVEAKFGDRGGVALNSLGLNLRTTTAATKRRKYLTAEETEAAAKASLGEGATLARDIRALPLRTAQLEDAIAGRALIDNIKEAGRRTGEDTVAEGFKPDKEWFTIDHPAFRTWRPKFETDEATGKTVPVKDANDNIIFQQIPIYVRGDYEGPLRSVLTTRNGKLYSAAMDLKGKTMSLIMNSPLIHNAVEWGRALPAMPGKVATFKVYFEGNAAKNNPAVMREAIDNGLVPIGHRFFKQDISSIMEEPNLTPGRSWTAKVLGFVPGLFDESKGTAVRAAIDKAGDFWHNTLLWDRVGDLQMGLYTNFRDDLLAKGVDRQTASRAAAHWANRYAGALPQEAMSDNARKIANMLLFSRSFTLGNIGAIKDMLTGLPRDVMAQVSRDVGSLDPSAAGYIKKLAARKAVSIVMMDMALMYVGNSLLQSAMNVLIGDTSLDQEMHGYAERMQATLANVKEHPLSLLQPFNFFQSMSATSQNEPAKQDRIMVGFAKDGTAIYARNPAGKIGEEFTGYLTGPLDMIRKKLGTIARPAWQIATNDKGFGRKIYDPNADTPAKYLKNMGLIVGHLVASQFPEGQISAAADLVKGEGDAKVSALQAFGPLTGVTFSKGAPGGPAVGELYHAREMHQYAVDAAISDIRKQIQRGDLAGARQQMLILGIPKGLQDFYIRTGINPATRLGGRTLRDFYLSATPEQRLRLENARALSSSWGQVQGSSP